MSTLPNFLSLTAYQEYSPAEMRQRAADFYAEIKRRRTVPREIIEDCLRAAGTAPNGANLQPWRFVVVSDPAINKQIRAEAEKEDYEFYHGKAPQEWRMRWNRWVPTNTNSSSKPRPRSLPSLPKHMDACPTAARFTFTMCRSRWALPPAF